MRITLQDTTYDQTAMILLKRPRVRNDGTEDGGRMYRSRIFLRVQFVLPKLVHRGGYQSGYGMLGCTTRI